MGGYYRQTLSTVIDRIIVFCRIHFFAYLCISLGGAGVRGLLQSGVETKRHDIVSTGDVFFMRRAFIGLIIDLERLLRRAFGLAVDSCGIRLSGRYASGRGGGEVARMTGFD